MMSPCKGNSDVLISSIMEARKITVVTVVRNAADLIEQTIQSVSSQTYPNVEYLVVDGASTDGTVEVIRRHEREIGGWVSEPDKGIADAFNKGAFMASGDTVLYMNAGDEFADRTSLELLVAGAPRGTELRQSITYGDAIIVLPSGRGVYASADHGTIGATSHWKLWHQSALIGIEVQRRFPYDSRLMLHMDHDFWLRCIDARVDFYSIKHPVCRYLAGGLSGNPRYKLTHLIEGYLVRLLNGRRPKTLGTALAIAGTAAVVEGKSKLRELIGDRAFSVLKRAAGLAAE
jgi:glycosyltransferase involved in cell wall biosynthesis